MNIIQIDEISRRCQAAEDYVSKIDQNFKELKKSCTECINYNKKVIAINMGPKSLSKSMKQLELMTDCLKANIARYQEKCLQ